MNQETTALALIKRPQRKITLAYKAHPELKEAIRAIVEEEEKDGRSEDVTESMVTEFLVESALPLYWLRHAEQARFKAVEAEFAEMKNPEAKALEKIIRAGLDALEAEKKRKP